MIDLQKAALIVKKPEIAVGLEKYNMKGKRGKRII